MRPLTQQQRRTLRIRRRQALRDLAALPHPFTLGWHRSDEERRRWYTRDVQAFDLELSAPHDEAEHARSVRWMTLHARLYGAVASLAYRRERDAMTARYEAWAAEYSPTTMRRALDEICIRFGGFVPEHVVEWEKRCAEKVAA